MTTAVDRLAPGDHICWTFRTDDERLTTMLEFVGAGLGAGEKVLCFTEEIAPRTLRSALADLGVDIEAAGARGQARFHTADASYLATGRFDAEAVLDGWHRQLAEARQEGYTGLRVIADMTWAARRPQVDGAERLAWYEARASRIFADAYATVVCMYDQRLFPGDRLRDIAAAHPAAVSPRTADDWHPQLRLVRTADPAGLCLIGEADRSCRDALEAVLAGLAEDLPTGGPVTVDVSRLAFADVGCAAALARTAGALPYGMRIVGASAALHRLLEMIGADAP
ncbi:MEDS domain-containing protein [Planomonospora corallina]|uniref:MEDS domain-containing protein n=1 Tax=Planomonospora corallina TaxID=1806052 RepID=A0ABV8I4K5_9ACTN